MKYSDLIVVCGSLLLFGCGIPSASSPPTTAQPLFAEGTKDGGGGKGVLCNGRLRTLDLYEAKEIHHLPLVDRYPDLQSSLANYGLALSLYLNIYHEDPSNPMIQEWVSQQLKEQVVDLFIDIPSGSQLPLTSDATAPTLLPGCQIVQIAIYSDTQHRILRDPVLWNQLDVNDQTALILHEALYRYAREMNAMTPKGINSDDSRRLVGLTLAGRLPEAMFQPVWNAPKGVWCAVGTPGEVSSEAFAVDETRDGKNGVAFYFKVLNGELLMGRTSAFFSGPTLDQLWDQKFESPQTTASESIFSRNWSLAAESLPTSPGERYRVVLPLEEIEGPIGDLRGFQMKTWTEGTGASHISHGICATDSFDAQGFLGLN